MMTLAAIMYDCPMDPAGGLSGNMDMHVKAGRRAPGWAQLVAVSILECQDHSLVAVHRL